MSISQLELIYGLWMQNATFIMQNSLVSSLQIENHNKLFFLYYSLHFYQRGCVLERRRKNLD